MGSINRGTLPQNFLDSVSSGITLATPEPQYFFARMAQGNRALAQALNAGMQTAQQFGSIAGGGRIQDPALDSMLRAADAYPMAVMAMDAFGKGQGDTIKFDRDIFEGGGYDETSRLLGQDAVISTTGQVINNEETVAILRQFVGPYSSSASAVRPYAIDDFSAKYRANKVQLASKVTRHLRRDYTKWLDRVIRAQFLRSTNITYPNGISAATDFTAGLGAGAGLEQFLKAKEALSRREWKKFGNGKYMCLVPPSFTTQMSQDPDFRQLSANHQADKNPLYGYIGSVQDMDFFECTTLAQYSDNGGDDIATLNGGTIAAGAVVEEALIFGPETVGFGTADSPECRWADDTNYGTVAKVIWYAMHAFQTLDTRGIQRVPYQGTDA